MTSVAVAQREQEIRDALHKFAESLGTIAGIVSEILAGESTPEAPKVASNVRPEAYARPAGSAGFTHYARMGLHYRTLKGLLEAGGQMDYRDFADMAKQAGYTRGYGQYCADRASGNRMCDYDPETNLITINDNGRAAFEYAKAELRITG